MDHELYSTFGDHSLSNFSKPQEVVFINHFTGRKSEAQEVGVIYPILHNVKCKPRSVCIQHSFLDHLDK